MLEVNKGLHFWPTLLGISNTLLSVVNNESYFPRPGCGDHRKGERENIDKGCGDHRRGERENTDKGVWRPQEWGKGGCT